MDDAGGTTVSAAEHLRIARLMEAHGDAIGAILAYCEVIRLSPGATADEARARITDLARHAESVTPR